MGGHPKGLAEGAKACHFWYGHSLGPMLEPVSMHVVPFPPVLGYAISGTVIVRVPYRHWTLCAWFHFRYWAMPFPVRSFTGPRTGSGLYARSSKEESKSAFLLALTAKVVFFVTCIMVKYDT